jgi:hypothetical protein
MAPSPLEEVDEILLGDRTPTLKIDESFRIHLVMNDGVGRTNSHAVTTEVAVILVGKDFYSAVLFDETS